MSNSNLDEARAALPISAMRSVLEAALREHETMVLVGATGSGK